MPDVEKKNRAQRGGLLAKYDPYIKDNITLLHKARKGLRPDAISDLIKITGFSNDIIESVLNKSMKTFQNYLFKKTPLDIATSEKVLKLLALFNKGVEVFGSVDAFSEWLSRPAYGLGEQIPLSLLDTMTGVDLINEELVRIEYGDLA